MYSPVFVSYYETVCCCSRISDVGLPVLPRKWARVEGERKGGGRKRERVGWREGEAERVAEREAERERERERERFIAI